MTNDIYRNMWERLDDYFFCSELISYENELSKAEPNFLEVEKERFFRIMKKDSSDIHSLYDDFSKAYETKIDSFKSKREGRYKIDEDIPHQINVTQNKYAQKHNEDDLIKIGRKYLDLLSKSSYMYGEQQVGPSRDDTFKNYLNDWYFCAINFFYERKTSFPKTSFAVKYNSKNKEKNTFYNYINAILKTEASRISCSKSFSSENTITRYDELTSTLKRWRQHIKKALTNLGFDEGTEINSLTKEDWKKIVNELKSNPDFKSGNYKKLDEIKLQNKWNQIQSILNMQSLNVPLNSDDNDETELLDTIADESQNFEINMDITEIIECIISKLDNIEIKEKDKTIFCAKFFLDYINSEMDILWKDNNKKLIKNQAKEFDEIEPEISHIVELFKGNKEIYQTLKKLVDLFREKSHNKEQIKVGDLVYLLDLKQQSEINRSYKRIINLLGNDINKLLCKEE